MPDSRPPTTSLYQTRGGSLHEQGGGETVPVRRMISAPRLRLIHHARHRVHAEQPSSDGSYDEVV
jgi:hypothetical protein